MKRDKDSYVFMTTVILEQTRVFDELNLPSVANELDEMITVYAAHGRDETEYNDKDFQAAIMRKTYLTIYVLEMYHQLRELRHLLAEYQSK